MLGRTLEQVLWKASLLQLALPDPPWVIILLVNATIP